VKCESEDSQQPAQHHRSLAQIAKTIWETAGRAIAAPSSQLPSKTGQEAPTPPLAPGMASEFVIRASGADKAAMKHMVCRFPQAFKPDPASGEAANAPDLKRPGEAWVMGQMEDAEARPGTRGWAPPLPPPLAATCRPAACSCSKPCVLPLLLTPIPPVLPGPAICRLPGQWVLEEQAKGRPRFVGQPEGGARDTGAGYFLLMKGKGNEFIAVPVSEVFTFKPALQRRHQRYARLSGGRRPAWQPGAALWAHWCRLCC
jgi:hypothetical protein